MNKPALVLALTLLSVAASTPAAEIRFYPGQVLWAQQTEAARGLNNVVMANAAVVHTGDAPRTLVEVRFELLYGDEPLQSQYLRGSRLDAVARNGGALARSGMMQALDFQFGGTDLLGEGTTVSEDSVLQQGEALYLPTRYFAYAGLPDRLRVTAIFDDGEPAVGELPIRHDTAPGAFGFPARGRWFVGAATTPHSHHRWAVPQEFALDLIRIGKDGRSHRGDGTRVRHYFAYGQPVLATADGEVVAVRDELPDNIDLLRRSGEPVDAQMARVMAFQDAALAGGGEDMIGNHVLLRHAEGVYTVYAHLAPGSVRVRAGQAVARGETLGAVGNSGSSTEPHLHFHACDAPQVLRCAGLPIAFDDVELPFADHPRQIQSGDFVDAR
ncbi:MAG: M23 family metallopeptidase [Xanthomonadales bacterium]|nr:M23 family metallopeptidase [Xanthomonadales bacterium]